MLRKWTTFVLLNILIVMISFSTGCSQDKGLYSVLQVVDGDTITVLYNGKPEKVRLIGVNTPETKHPAKGVESYGIEASEFTKKQLSGQKVRLEFDVQPRDKYGRLLAYVYLQDGTFYNALLVSEGYAQVMTVPPNVRYAEKFVSLQRKARKAEKGLWGLPPDSGSYQIPEKQGEFLGSLQSKKYHWPECQWAQKISTNNKVWFSSEGEAKNNGYIPCKVCNPP